MNDFNNKNVIKLITTFYFAIAIVEVTAELFAYKPFLFVFKPSISVVLMVLYWNSSNQRNVLFFLTIFFSLLTNMFFIPNTEKMLFLGILSLLIHRFLIIYYIAKLTKFKDYIPLLIATIPFLFVFFYLMTISSEIPKNSFYILILQNVLVSIIGGISLSDYIMNDNKKYTLLLIFGLLTVMLYFIVFIEKYYLGNLSPVIFRPIAMMLNATVYYVFYRFVIETELQNSEN
ncbi:hypothetical protein [Flavobacterium sp.]|uniref:hypothetical protein n=1 Tax=Flavobacterium sp. TaxID=239 RepID=UPI00286D6860|nr:hypothetical protein [Flavobacterium sp.]